MKQNKQYQVLNNGLTEVKQELNQSSIEESSIEEYRVEENSSSFNNLYDPRVEKIQEIMIETLGTTNTNNILECCKYLDKIPLELIEYALRKTARIERPSWQYTIPILESYIDKNIKTVEEAKADDLKHKTKNKQEEKQETKEEKIARWKKEWGVVDEN